MSRTYAVIAEMRGNQLRQVSFEALGAVAQMASAGDRIIALVIGHELQEAVQSLSMPGIAQIYCAEDERYKYYDSEAYFSALRVFVEQESPEVVLFGHTAMGRDLAPMLAAHLHTGQISDVISILPDSDGFAFRRPVYAGKAFETRRFTTHSNPWIITIRPNNFPALTPEAGALPTQAPVSSPAVVALPAPAPSLRTVVRDVVTKMSGSIDLSEAKIIVSGGRGVKSSEGFKPLEQLARVLNGAVGASRGACDAGYCDYALQIGQTGKVVTPEIYFACGISGAIQHLAGMSQSRVIIAINIDPEAPIFQMADYGIVGDLFEVVPLLTTEFRKMLV
ncbi:electron transfer flavoprotein subunit alpha/FixB family protein [Paenibacillus apiarius]|uniref:electron transfer flavoprotein subunit alpha/FixB family protein n=1 Tax=Paenibacillus apiarius TaxID=46240 RepID=UPI00198016FF|nr:electron transfer flavoprotein subunit alpha/FixB family protein [Paenibacillus apiarius]MBN3526288.1 electron transfer flavoprotein subunit alpha/FixB family protein [Paenibacillus apiarius]